MMQNESLSWISRENWNQTTEYYAISSGMKRKFGKFLDSMWHFYLRNTSSKTHWWRSCNRQGKMTSCSRLFKLYSTMDLYWRGDALYKEFHMKIGGKLKLCKKKSDELHVKLINNARCSRYIMNFKYLYSLLVYW